MISVKKLTKRFNKLVVLDNLDLEVQQCGVFAILGPNGSGKTTLIKCLLGMVLPDKGEIHLNGKNIKGQWNYRKEITYLPQIANFPPNLTVKEIIAIVKEIRNAPANESELIELFSLQSFLHKKLSQLSGGTKQKVNILLAFMFNVNIMILDEPTNGLDPISVIKLKQLIATKKKEGKTIYITSHIMSFVEEVADEIVFLLEGKINFKGTILELKKNTNSQTLEQSIAQLLS